MITPSAVPAFRWSESLGRGGGCFVGVTTFLLLGIDCRRYVVIRVSALDRKIGVGSPWNEVGVELGVWAPGRQRAIRVISDNLRLAGVPCQEHLWRRRHV